MITILKNNKVYFTGVLLSLIYICIVLIYKGKIDAHLWVNQFHNTFFDLFFKYVTHIGDGYFAGIVFLILLFLINIRTGILLAISFFSSAAITQFLKKIIFDNWMRPSFLIDNELLHLVDDVQMRVANSFPSGHTTAAFCLFTMLALCTHKNKNIYGFLFFIFAFIAGFSRIYLSQHFFEDVLIGAIIGSTTSVFVFFIFNDKFLKYNKKSFLLNN